MLVKFPTYLQKYTDGLDEYNSEGATVGYCLMNLCTRFPQLAVELLTHPERLYVLFLDEELLHKKLDVQREFTNTSVLHIESLTVAGSDGDSFIDFFVDPLAYRLVTDQQVFGVMGYGWTMPGARTMFGEQTANELAYYGMTVAGYIFMLIPGFQLVGMALLAMASLAEAGLTASLMQPNLMNGTLNNSSTYTFYGVQNTTASGTPFHIVYGKHRVGGQVLNIYTEGTDPVTLNGIEQNQTLLYAQIGIGEGEIESVSDIHINKFPVAYYSAVETAPHVDYVRLGSETQSPMPAFTQVQNTNSLNIRVNKLDTLPTIAARTSWGASYPVYGCIENKIHTDAEFSWQTSNQPELKLGFYIWEEPSAPPINYADIAYGG